MSGLTTAESWAFARENLCHICNGDATDTCEACGRRTCLTCSTPDQEDPIRFCRECLEDEHE